MPGHIVQGMMDRRIYDEIERDTLHVGIQYTVLRPIAEMVYVQYPPSGTFEGDQFFVDRDPAGRDANFEEENIHLSAEGKLVMIGEEGGGDPYLDVSFWNEDMRIQFGKLGDTATTAEAMIATGKFEYVETVTVDFDLRVEEHVRSLLAEGEYLEADYGDFIMRVVSAELAPSTLEILVDAIFPDEATAREWVEPHDDSLGMVFHAFDEEGRDNWGDHSGGGPAIRESVEELDGTWRMQYEVFHTQMTYTPDTLIVRPIQLIRGGEGVFAVLPNQRVLDGGVTIEISGGTP